MKIAWLCCCVMLTACQPTLQNSQILAQVGNREITQLQYELALQKLGINQPSPAIRQEVLEKLVQREQAIQQAEAFKLDLQPQVQLQIEEARRDIVARAYAEHQAQRADKADANLISRYYQQHPELFAERRIYYLREIALPADFPLLNDVKQRVQQQQSLEQISQWLQQQQQTFNQQVAVRAAEQLPLAILPQLNQGKAQQTLSFVSPRGILLYQVLDSYPAPLKPAQAQPLIQSYLDKQNARRLLLNELNAQAPSVRYLQNGS